MSSWSLWRLATIEAGASPAAPAATRSAPNRPAVRSTPRRFANSRKATENSGAETSMLPCPTTGRRFSSSRTFILRSTIWARCSSGRRTKSLEANPQDGEAHINLGHVLYEEGRFQAAVERLEEGLRRSPRSSVGHFLLGCSYLKLGYLPKAESNLKEAYSLDPTGMARARLELANLYLRRRDMAAASVELESYLDANPSDPQAPAIKKMLANIAAHKTN
ncbi:MAG: hypothetical protein DMG26_14530 [Acidobacteria bacterium]|nr:MAG: hypothetical protein DMG26_14530 [Acidobacteriota bacterium]